MRKTQLKMVILALVAMIVLLPFQNCSTPQPAEDTVSPQTNLENAVPLDCPGGIYNGSLVVSVNTVATGNCTVAGNLSVTGDATLLIDYSKIGPDKFVVRGDVSVDASGTISVVGSSATEDLFVIANDYSGHRSLTTSGSGTISLKQIEFRTQETVDNAKGSLYMSVDTSDNSKLSIENSKLDLLHAWLLANLHGSSSLTITNSKGLPSENYVHDSSRLKIVGPSTETGLWLDAKGAVGTLTVPNVNSPFSWKIGKDNGLDVGWLLEVENSNPGMGIEIRQGTNLEIHGNGTSAPNTGELKISYFVESGTESLNGLNAGIQNNIVSPRLKLVNVQLGPVAWQIYAGENSVVNISNSKINEIGIYGTGANVTVNSSILQFAVLGAMAPSCKLKIQNSQVWNQSIEAANNAEVTISGSHVYGSLLHARDAAAKISISNSIFHENPAGCSPATMVDISTGQPLCNPFRAAGMPSKSGPGQILCTNTNGC